MDFETGKRYSILFVSAAAFLISSCLTASEPVYTYVDSDGIGRIAVRIESPEIPRYPQGAPVVVEVSTWFVPFVEFHRVNDTKRIGAVTVSYLWPGRVDAETGMTSDGKYDYGGPVSLAALKDVIRFASGIINDIDGQSIADLCPLTVLTENIGLFASSHSGVVATNVLACFGAEISNVKYLVARENPTREEMYPLEIGHFDGDPAAENRVINSYYNEENYFPDTLIVDYSTVGWYQPEGEPYGRPYFAASGEIPEHILYHEKIPDVYNKRYYSRNITHALLDNGALSLNNWPDYLATPDETDAFWPYRITVHNYPEIALHNPELKVMMVFSRYDHVQAAVTKPHIHQAWDGFFHQCGFWVRMNPDRAYANSVNPDYNLAFPDNDANREPVNWIYIEDCGFPADSRVRKDIWLASVAEMADRVYTDNWDDNLDTVFFQVLFEPQNSISDQSEQIQVKNIFYLYPAFPNPFNPDTGISLELFYAHEVIIEILNMRGQVMNGLFKGKLTPGKKEFVWDASSCESGVYLCRIRSGNQVQTQKLLFLK